MPHFVGLLAGGLLDLPGHGNDSGVPFVVRQNRIVRYFWRRVLILTPNSVIEQHFG